MEDDKVKIYDVPSKTRNYTIIDNTTGKPMNQENFSLEVNPSVIDRLKALKKVNEEKIKEAENKEVFEDTGIINAFTPEDPTMFTENKGEDYIDAIDFKDELAPVLTEETGDEAVGTQGEFARNKILERVKARDNEEEEEQPIRENEFSSMFEYKEEKEEEFENLNQPLNQTYSYQDPNLNPTAGFNENPLQNKEVEKYEERVARSGNNRMFAILSYIPFVSLFFIWTKNKFLKFHAVEGFQYTLYTIFAFLFLAPYVAIQHEIIKNVNLSSTINTILLLVAIIGLVMLCAGLLSIILGMTVAVLGKKAHIPLLWFKRKKIKEQEENLVENSTNNTNA